MQRKTCLLLVSLFITSAALAQTDSVEQRIILIGDAGEVHQGVNPTVDAVRKFMNVHQGSNTILFLGDNVYPLGLPDRASPHYPLAKEILDYQAGLLRGTTAEGIFIPGNHDWSKHRPDGWQVIRNQQRYIDSLKLPNLRFLPKDGCPDPTAIPIGDNAILIVMDSEWWLYPGEKPGLESGCECKTEDDVLSAVSDIVALNPGKLVVMAMHHPLRSYSIHGGYYTLKQHIFPLTDAHPSLYVPMPVIGSVYPLVRGVFGTREDLPHPLYRRLVKGLEEAIPQGTPVVFTAGHDHTLQLIKEKDRHYIVSGAGVKDSRVKKGSKALFTSRRNGFTTIDILRNGAVNVSFYNDADAAPMYTQTLLNMQQYTAKLERQLAAMPRPAYVTMPADTQYTKAGKLHRKILGNNYREVWATPLTFPVIDLDTAKGGLKIIKRGGGMQTRSLRLEDSKGNEWVLRTLRKWPATAIPQALRETIAKEVVQDQISAANPYAPAAVSALAEATGVPHTNPAFVYLPDDTSLGIYRKDFANDVYLLEEREPVTANKTYNTFKVLEELEADNDNSVDQPSFLRARLLDILIADWDRHEDQWRWYAEKGKDKTKVFFPIPRDRDQAFFINEGLLPRIAARSWIMPKIQGFRPRTPNINTWAFSARFQDRSFLNELDEPAWRAGAYDFSQAVTDSVIEHAIHQLPDTIRSQVGPRMLHTLKSRRNYLQEDALEYYRFISKAVTVTGSEKNELFTITHMPEGRIQVTAQKISKKGKLEQTLYSRTFDPAVTKEVRVFGLGGDDEFRVQGSGASPIRLRLIGGREQDTYVDQSSGPSGKRLLIYDLKNGKDSFAVDRRTKLRLSTRPENIAYNRQEFKYNKLMPMAAGGFNLDDGLLLGLGLQYTGNSFRKEPFAEKHTFTGIHALATKAFSFKYAGEFTDVFGRSDLLVNALARAPHNTMNFFGFGNETSFDKQISDPPIRYYRSRFNVYSLETALRSTLAQNITATFGPSVTIVSLTEEENEGRYLTDYDINHIDSASIFRNKLHVGLRAGLNIDTRDNTIIPTRGLLWNTSIQGNKGLTGFSYDYTQLRTDLSIYASFGLPAKAVLVTRFGGGVTWGRHEFFQALTLGGTANLRGYRNHRFAGNSMVYNNIEIRARLFEFTSYLLPGSVGLIAFNDVGRVWMDGENSRQWHNGFGGGLYVSPVNMLVITAVVGHSPEETLPYVTFGFRF